MGQGCHHQNSLDLAHHLSTTGFVYVTNHGVSEDKINAFRDAGKEFFAKDLDYKSTFRVEDPGKYEGYKVSRLVNRSVPVLRM